MKPASHPDDPRDSDSPFGVLEFLSWDQEKFAHHYGPGEVEKSLDLMREAGVGFVRFDFLWEEIEPQRGRFAFEKYDHIVDAAFSRGIKILGLLGYTPGWHSGHWNNAPDPLTYGRYAKMVVEHFKNRIRHWQLWHEPDNPNFWQPQDQMRGYTTMIKQVYPLMKAADPTCVVHLAGMSRSLPGCLKSIYDNGGKDAFDVVAIDPFANPLTPHAVNALEYLQQSVRRVLAQYDDSNKPIWFTEIGCPGMKDPQSAPNWWLGKNPSEQEQANWLKTVYENTLRWPGVEKVFWCFFRDTREHFKSGSDYDGLIRNDFSKKPSFDVYRTLTGRRPQAIPATKNPD